MPEAQRYAPLLLRSNLSFLARETERKAHIGARGRPMNVETAGRPDRSAGAEGIIVRSGFCHICCDFTQYAAVHGDLCCFAQNQDNYSKFG
jgi:hypothetical protein